MALTIFIIISIALLEAFNRAAYRLGLKQGIESILGCYTLFWAWVVALSWFLSLINLLTSEAFGIATIMTVFSLFTFVEKPPATLTEQIIELVRKARSFVRENWVFGVPLMLMVLWFCWAIYRILLLPPITWDVMTYHLPAIANWIQHGSMDIYETTTTRQLINPINGELLQLFHVIFVGQDTVVQLVQLESFAVIVLGSYYLSRLSGLSIGWSLNAAAAVLTVPLLLLQSYTTQNDLVVASGTVLPLIWIGVYISRPAIPPLALICMSAALLLGTKIHMIVAYPVILLVGLFILVYHRSNLPFRKHVIAFALMNVIFGVFLGGIIYIRNWNVYGTALPVIPELANIVEHTFVIGVPTLMENVTYFGYWWLVRCWDFTSSRAMHHDESQYGPYFGYVILPFALVSGVMLLLGLFKKGEQRRENSLTLSIFLIAFGAFMGFAISHRPRPSDLRYLLFLPPLFSCVTAWMLSRIGSKLVKIVGFLLGVIAIPIVYLAMTQDSTSDLKFAFSLEPYQRTSVHVGLKNPDRLILRRLDQLALPGESILYCGMEDDWNYPLFGNDFSRHVYYADSVRKARYYLDYYSIDWIMVRNDREEIVRYLQLYPGKFKELHFSSVYAVNRFRLFRVRAQDDDPAWTDGIYGDAWSKRTFLVGASQPGTFLVQCVIPAAYDIGISMNIRIPGEPPRDTLLKPSVVYKFELPLRQPGQINFTLNKTIIPSQSGIGSQNYDVGIRVPNVVFYPNPNSSRIQVFPK